MKDGFGTHVPGTLGRAGVFLQITILIRIDLIAREGWFQNELGISFVNVTISY